MPQVATRRALLLPPAVAAALAGLWRGARPERRGAAATGEPSPTPTVVTSGGAGRTPLLAAAYETLPPAPAAVTLTRMTFPPLSSVAGIGSAGPRLVLVERQSLTLSLWPGTLVGQVNAGEVAVSGTTASVVTEADALRLAIEGQAFILDTAPRELRNDGPHPAALLIAEVVPLPDGPGEVLPAPVAWETILTASSPPAPGAVTAAPTPTPGATPALPRGADALPAKPFMTGQGILVEPLAGGAALTLPDGPGLVRLDRLILETGAAMPLPVQPGPWLLLVESGTLGLAALGGLILYRSAAASTPGALPGRAKVAAEGSEVVMTAGGMAFVHPDAAADLRNRGRPPVSLQTLAIVPARAEIVGAPAPRG